MAINPPKTVARPSVASLYLEACIGNQPLGSATGFPVKRGDDAYLITNWHVVRGRRPDNNQPTHQSGAVPDKVAIAHHVGGKLGFWKPVVEDLYDGSGTPRWLEHQKHGRRVDVVALPLTNLAGVDLFGYDPWDTTGAAIAFGPSDVVSIVGFPFGRTGGGFLAIWVAGSVASEPSMDFDNLPAILVDSRTREGQSGSPVILYRNGGMVALEGGGASVFAGPVERFIGVYSGRINPTSDLGIVWKAAAVREIIEAGVRGQP